MRLKQAANDRNRQKLQKLLYRVKEIKPDKVDVEIVRAERVLRELVEQEGNDVNCSLVNKRPLSLQSTAYPSSDASSTASVNFVSLAFL